MTQTGAEGRIDRKPLRVVSAPTPSFSGVAVDLERNEVYASDENLSQILVYDRLANTPAAAARTEPRRTLAGEATKLEFVSNVYVDPGGEIYATHGDSMQLLVFSRKQQGDVPPLRQLRTPKSRSLAVDERHGETSSSASTTAPSWSSASIPRDGKPPVRLVQGDRTGLSNPHGIVIDRRNEVIFVTNHGQRSSRSAEGVNPTRLVPNWPLERGLAVPGTGRFEPPSISVHARGSQGDTPPLQVISGPRTQLNWPAGVTLDEERGELVVAGSRRGARQGASSSNDDEDGGQRSPSHLLVFNRTAEGNARPLRGITGPKTLLVNTKNVRVHPPTGLILIARDGTEGPQDGISFVGVWSIHDDGDVAPRWSIGGPGGMLSKPRGLDLDPAN